MHSSLWEYVVEYVKYLSIDRVAHTDLCAFITWQEVLGQEGGQAQDDSELNVLRVRVKTLSSEKVALQGKLKKLSQAKKG